MTPWKLSQFCITFVEHVPVTSYFSFLKKRRGEENLFKRDGENPLFSHLFFLPPFPFFSFPLLFFGKEKYDVIGTCSAKVIQNWDSFGDVELDNLASIAFIL